MKEENKKKVRKSVLKSKKELENDISKKLKQYGIFPDRLVDIEKLDLSKEQRRKRRDLEQILEKIKHKDTGDKTEQEYYVRKTAYTYFNRLAALKLMESHSLLENVITPNPDFGNQPELLFHYKDVTDLQRKDALYESYFTGIFNDLDQEIGKIFDMSDQTSILFPSAGAIDTVIEELDQIPQEAWKQEEIIGWMYQYFISEEKDEAFDKLNNDNQKINGSTLPAVTSLYTPHWIVEYLVDNTLGVMWKEMHPDTDIEEVCDYIVPDQQFEEREAKDIEEITLLDPACGSGHFLLYAFDVFKKMYEEEGYDKKEIPKKILENNLYGIDVDNRSSQLSALALYVKAKELTPEADISQLNIISADAVLMNGEKKEKLLERCRHEIEEDVVEEIWNNFQHLDERGSLVKIEEPVREKITEYKNNLSKDDKDQQLIHQFSDQTREVKSSSGQQKLAESVSTEEYWGIIEERMVQRIQELGQEAIQAQDMSEQLFAAETEKSLHLLDYLMEDYDVVTTNPPYLGRRNLDENIKTFLRNNYKGGHADLYSAFIMRTQSFARENGFTGMITQDTFMFLSSFEKLRSKMLGDGLIQSMNHLGTHVFPEISGEKVRSVAYTFRNKNLDADSTFYRLVYTEDKEKKTKSYIEQEEGSWKYQRNQNTFKDIDGVPLIYWISDSLLKIFREEEILDDEDDPIAIPKAGMQTGDNDRFLKYWWEINAENMGEKWIPYMKGGEALRWYGNMEWVLDWQNEGEDVRNNGGSVLRNEQFYFEEGITYNLTSEEFAGRYMPEGCIFDVRGSSIFPQKTSLFYLMGMLNSKVSSYFLRMLNPSLAFQVGDLKRLPFTEPGEENKEEVEKKVEECIEIRKDILRFDETSKEFDNSLILSTENNGGVKDRFAEGLTRKEENIVDLAEKEGEINNLMYDIFGLTQGDKENLYREVSRPATEFEKEDPEVQKLEEYYVEGKEVPWGSRTKTKRMEIDDIARDLEVHPRSILESRKELDIYREDDLEEEVKRLLSYVIQASLGRWEMEGVEPDKDGILMVSEEVSSDNPSLMDKIRECIAAEWGEENVSDIESEINNILYHGMEKWIKKYFFKNFHYKMYNKRPVVWEIRTPDDHFKAFIYYHKLDEDTLPKLQVDYIEPLITEYKNKKNLAENSDNKAEAETLEDKVEDLKELKEQLEEVIDDGYSPDLDEGVKHNFKPIEHMTGKEMK